MEYFQTVKYGGKSFIESMILVSVGWLMTTACSGFPTISELLQLAETGAIFNWPSTDSKRQLNARAVSHCKYVSPVRAVWR